MICGYEYEHCSFNLGLKFNTQLTDIVKHLLMTTNSFLLKKEVFAKTVFFFFLIIFINHVFYCYGFIVLAVFSFFLT